jgi:Short C-terminal domain
MTTNPVSRMAVAFWVGLVVFGSLSTAEAAAPKPAPVSLGNNTYRLTRSARFAFSFDTDKLKKQAREDAIKFCDSLGKKMKELSISAEKASLIYGGFSSATIIFKALDPADPELADASTPATGLNDLDMLVHLHDRKLLSDAEFESAKNRLNERSSDLDALLELKRKGVLTDAEFEAARNRLMERAK